MVLYLQRLVFRYYNINLFVYKLLLKCKLQPENKAKVFVSLKNWSVLVWLTDCMNALRIFRFHSAKSDQYSNRALGIITLNSVKSLIHSSRAFRTYRDACMQVYMANTLIQHSSNVACSIMFIWGICLYDTSRMMIL